jgi:hypothetical protein
MELYQNWLALYIRCFAIFGQVYCAWLQLLLYDKRTAQRSAPIRVIRVESAEKRETPAVRIHEISPPAWPMLRDPNFPLHPNL